MTGCPNCARLQAQVDEHRRLQTLGGPPPPVTHSWIRGDSTRPPTAPPEPAQSGTTERNTT